MDSKVLEVSTTLLGVDYQERLCKGEVSIYMWKITVRQQFNSSVTRNQLIRWFNLR